MNVTLRFIIFDRHEEDKISAKKHSYIIQNVAFPVAGYYYWITRGNNVVGNLGVGLPVSD